MLQEGRTKSKSSKKRHTDGDLQRIRKQYKEYPGQQSSIATNMYNYFREARVFLRTLSSLIINLFTQVAIVLELAPVSSHTYNKPASSLTSLKSHESSPLNTINLTLSKQRKIRQSWNIKEVVAGLA